ncbi:hypothetical protein vseg_008132 [Gypsophila vaccaria]
MSPTPHVKKPVYDLTNQDGTGAKITHVELKGSNYEEWAKGFRNSLGAKRKIGFIDGTLKQPAAGSADLEDWQTVNHTIIAWIFNTIEPTLRSTISYRDTSYELWADIKERFFVGNGIKIYQLESDISDCKQQSGESIMVYYSRMKKLWDAVNDYDTLPYCSCSGCTCDLNKTYRQRRETRHVRAFLMGLDPYFITVRSQLLGIEPLPSLHSVYSRLMQEEEVRNITQRQIEATPAMAFAVRGAAHKSRPLLKCTFCSRNGHLEDRCWEKHGYPEGRGPRRVNRPTDVAGAEPVVTKIRTNAVTGEKNLGVHSVRLNGKHDFIWLIDTGASTHVCGNLALLDNVTAISPLDVGLPDGNHSKATHKGHVKINCSLTLENVLFIPNFTCNLLSVSQLLLSQNLSIHFTNSECAIQDPILKTRIGVGELIDGLYQLQMDVSSRVNVVKGGASFDLWHKRLGHPSLQVMKFFPQFRGSQNNFATKHCDICLRSKQTRSIFSLSNNKAAMLFDLIHCDVWGPYKPNLACGSRYFLSIVDDYSRCVWVFLMKSKAEVPTLLKEFFELIKRQFHRDIKVLRSDNGSELKPLLSYFRTNGIIYESSMVRTPQQNARVERKHRHILNVARALRFQSGLTIEFWGECVLTAAHLINRTPTRILDGKTPYELLYNKEPDLSLLRIFGCLAYAVNLTPTDKFDSRSRRCIFVGYPFGKKGWTLYDLATGQFFQSRDVQFIETEFPYSALTASDNPDIDANVADDDYMPSNDVSSIHSHMNLGHIAAESPSASPARDHTQLGDESVVATAIDPTVHSEAPEINGELHTDTQSTSSEEAESVLGRGKREKFPNRRHVDYVRWQHINTTVHPSSSSPTSVSVSGSPFPLIHFVNCDKMSSPHRAFLAAITRDLEPKYFKEAVTDSRWRKAMQEEIIALETNGTWTIEDLPSDKKAIGCMWVYKIKHNSDGSVERFKARLVALGNHQKEGIDFTETFAPTVKMVTVRTFLAVATIRKWELHQMDVHNAFLHGDLSEEVYMRMPPGFSRGVQGKVCRLRKSLYGLRQAPRCWYAKLASALIAYGFEMSISDNSLFTYRKNSVELHILVYVDDLVIAGNQSAAISDFKSYLSKNFFMKDLGKLKYFLGIEVARNSTGMFLCQRKYTLDLLSETGLLGCKPVSVPMEEKHNLALASDTPLTDGSKYRRLVGKLIYLTLTRPELSYSVHILTQFMQHPTLSQWEAALRVVRYLKGSPGQGIMFKTNGAMELDAYCDADWASCPLTRRSLTAYFVCLGGSPISWKTKKQATVSRSSTEAEYRAMASATCEILWLKALLKCLGVHITNSVSLHCDNQAAIHIANNPVFHERTKHIEIDCHFIRDEIRRGTVSPRYVHTHSQLADILTKALGRQRFQNLTLKLGITDVHAPS